MNSFADDLRPLLFDETSWFAELEESTNDYWVVWRVTKSQEPAWWKELLIAAAAFAQDHDLLPEYRRRFAGIPVRALSDSAADTERRQAVAPIWQIANELTVALYLERALGWTLESHEPAGFRHRIGDWQFRTGGGKPVFVEVKSLVEPELPGSGVFSRGIASDRLTSVLKGAYKQLPRDDRATLVVVVGFGLILEISHGIMHGDLFQTLFGRIQITFNVLPYVPGSERMGPSFQEMFAHAGKHRRLGCVAGLRIGGSDAPGLGFYAIHNPFADASVQLRREDLAHCRQFWVNDDGFGEELDGRQPRENWERIESFS